MGNVNSDESINKTFCPHCGFLMEKQDEYYGGTASVWEEYPVSSTGGSGVSLYPQQDIYHCTNPDCGRSLLKPS